MTERSFRYALRASCQHAIHLRESLKLTASVAELHEVAPAFRQSLQNLARRADTTLRVLRQVLSKHEEPLALPTQEE